VAGRAAAGQGDSRRRREGAPDTTRRSADDLRGRGDAVWLRRVHSPRNLAGDAAREHAEQALVLAAMQGEEEGAKASFSTPLFGADENRSLAALTVPS